MLLFGHAANDDQSGKILFWYFDDLCLVWTLIVIDLHMYIVTTFFLL